MKETKLTDYEQLLCIINGAQDFGVVGGMGDLVSNDKLATALIEQGCIIVKPMPNVRRKRYRQPSEVIRCNDCSVPHNKYTGCPKLNGLVTPPNFYCAFGEPR